MGLHLHWADEEGGLQVGWTNRKCSPLQTRDQLGRVGSQYASRADRQNRGHQLPSLECQRDWYSALCHPTPKGLVSECVGGFCSQDADRHWAPKDSAVSRATTLCRYANREHAVSLILPDGWRQYAPTTAEATFMSKCGRLSKSDMNRRRRHASLVGAPGG